MDQMKVGKFLRELRKENNFTQEQLAEKLNVSGRTVSRWETGNNMPDIATLVEIAEIYDVSIPEIIDGERKSETMNQEVKETALKLADYTERVNEILQKRLLRLTILALVGMIVFVIIEVLGLDTPNSFYEFIASCGLGLCFGTIIVMILFFTGILQKIKARHIVRKEMKNK